MPIDPMSFASGAGVMLAVLGGVTWLARVWWQARVNTASNRSLAEFKAEIDRAAASATFGYQRQLQDFNLYASKKHDVIAQLYELLLDAVSQIANSAQGVRVRADLSETDAGDASDYMEHHAQIPRGKRNQIIALWESDRTGALKLLHEFQDMMQAEHARRAVIRANNFRLRADIYLPATINAAVDSLTTRLQKLEAYTAHHVGILAPAAPPELKAIREQLADIKALMRAELTRSEF